MFQLEQLGVWIKLAGPKGGSFIYEVPQSKKLYCESGGVSLKKKKKFIDASN